MRAQMSPFIFGPNEAVEPSVELFGRRQPPVLRRQLTEFLEAVQNGSEAAVRSPDPQSVVDAFELCAAWEECEGANTKVDLV